MVANNTRLRAPAEVWINNLPPLLPVNLLIATSSGNSTFNMISEELHTQGVLHTTADRQGGSFVTDKSRQIIINNSRSIW